MITNIILVRGEGMGVEVNNIVVHRNSLIKKLIVLSKIYGEKSEHIITKEEREINHLQKNFFSVMILRKIL